jgi:hypothetical protein
VPQRWSNDAAHEALLLVATFILNHPQNPQDLTTDEQVTRECLKMNSRDHSTQTEITSTVISDTLNATLQLQVKTG